MSPMALLLLLLVLAYIGSLWASSERKRAFGSPSGIEYVALGALLGPEVLGVLGHPAMAAFEPIAIVALGWIGLIFGLECGMVGERRAPFTRIALGLVFAVTTALAAGYAVYRVLTLLDAGTGEHRLLVSAVVGLVSAESTRHAVRWIGDRQPLSGPLSTLLLELAAADDAPILVVLALLFGALAGEHTIAGITLAPMVMAAITIVSGLALGALSAWLIKHASSRVERWTILLGAVWLATGLNKSLGLSALAATFVLGLTLRACSSDAPRLRAQVDKTEGAVLLPALLLAGAHLAMPRSAAEAAIIVVAVLVRVAMSFSFGMILALATPGLRPSGLWLGAGKLGSGTLTMIVAYGVSLRCPPDMARPALSVAFVGTLLGELIGPAALRRALVAPAPSEPPSLSVEPRP